MYSSTGKSGGTATKAISTKPKRHRRCCLPRCDPVRGTPLRKREKERECVQPGSVEHDKGPPTCEKEAWCTNCTLRQRVWFPYGTKIATPLRNTSHSTLERVPRAGDPTLLLPGAQKNGGGSTLA
uniref:Uncharacterized protein n=1 Tax=Trypanosoma congolense (strain IL3000) TaxID=1068625 RepID=F9W594_TRYCI|nr:hypothetical protein, unlikely [Trypanosoma congolense IL3000]